LRLWSSLVEEGESCLLPVGVAAAGPTTTSRKKKQRGKNAALTVLRSEFTPL
jgi:hypothetical protein